MFEAKGLKILHHGSLEWHHLPTIFHENLKSGSKDIHGSFIPKSSKPGNTVSSDHGYCYHYVTSCVAALQAWESV
jgi:hypothetical protein